VQPCKTLLINILDLENVQMERENLQDVKLALTRCQNLCQKSTACNRLVIFLHVKN